MFGSAAAASTATLPDTVAPPVGVVTATVGAVLSTLTFTFIAERVLPAASRATAVRTWDPSSTCVEFQLTE